MEDRYTTLFPPSHERLSESVSNDAFFSEQITCNPLATIFYGNASVKKQGFFFIFYCFYGQNCTPITIYKSQCLYDNMDFNTDFHFRLNWLSIYNQVSVGPKHLISALLSVHDDRIQGETKTLGEIVLVKALFDGKWGFPFRIM